MNPRNSTPMPASGLDGWRTASFIFFDLGAMNLIAGVLFILFRPLPLWALGFSPASFWIGILFVMLGLLSWRIPTLPKFVSGIIVFISLAEIIRLIPHYERAAAVVLAQISFVLPTLFVTIGLLRRQLREKVARQAERNAAGDNSSPNVYRDLSSASGIHDRKSGGIKEAAALFSSMLLCVGFGLAALLIFASYLLPLIAASTNPFVNMFSDIVVIPLLLILFPLGAALGEFIWVAAGSRWFLSKRQLVEFIRYLRQIPFFSGTINRILERTPEQRKVSAPVRRQEGARLLAPRTVIPAIAIAMLVTIVSIFAFPLFQRSKAQSIINPPSSPDILLVSQSGQGNYHSINAAVKDAQPGMTVLVLPGVYREDIAIDKPITLAGFETGNGDAAVIECVKASCVRLSVDGATLRRLTIRAHAPLFSDETLHGVEIYGGRPVIEDCDVAAETGAGIIAAGFYTEPTIRRVRVHHTYLNGIVFTDQSRGMVEDSDIFETRWAALRVEMGSDPLVRRTKLHHSKMSGVAVRSEGAGTFEECDIFENGYSNVEVREESKPVFRRSRVFNSKQGGFFFQQHSFGVVEDCDIFGNAYAGIEIIDDSHPHITRSKIHHGQTAGIMVKNGGRGIIENSLIFENNSMGILVSSAGSPIIRNSTIRANVYSAFEVSQGGDPLVEHCQIYDGKMGGISVYEGGKGRYEDCSIFGNAVNNVSIRTHANPQIRRTRISDSRQAGILIMEDGYGTIEDCEIFRNVVGVEVKSNGAPIMRNCKINRNQQQGIIVHSGGAGTIEKSDLRGNLGGSWKIDAGARVTQIQNLE